MADGREKRSTRAGRAANRANGLKAGFVTAATDTGHSAALEPGASFALNRQKLLDFGFRSLHVTAEAAKLLARTYYGAGPTKSYYEGCSQGGRQGLTLAQRFPDDFDGIVAGAPALYQTGTHLARAYWMQGLNANPFPAAKLGLLAAKVYEQCDAKDGLKDGLIDDPRRCDFKPARDLPRCAEGSDQADCFTANQIAALERIYGDVMSKGKRFFPGWPVGAEVAGPNGQSGWIGQAINAANGTGAWTSYGFNFQRYMVPWVKSASGEMDAARAFSQFDIDKDPPRLEELRQILDANGPRSVGLPEARRQAADVLRVGRSATQCEDGRGVLRAGGGQDGGVDRRVFPPLHGPGNVPLRRRRGDQPVRHDDSRAEVGGSGHGAGSHRGQPCGRGQGGAHAAALRVSANGAVQGYGQHRRSGELHLREANRVNRLNQRNSWLPIILDIALQEDVDLLVGSNR